MSESEVSKFITEVPTWRVYPRVHYFSQRYYDVLQRFKRLVGAFPKEFQDKTLMSEINEIKDELSKALEVTVIGRKSLDDSHIVVSTKPWEREKISDLPGPRDLPVYICYANIKSLDEIGLEGLFQIVDYFGENFAQKQLGLYNSLFIAIDAESEQNDEGQDSFRRNVFEHICGKLSENEWEHSDRIIFGSQGSVLGSKITECFEKRLIFGFHKVLRYLERLQRKSEQYETDSIDILHTDIVVKVIQGILRDDMVLADLRKIAGNDLSEETEGMSPDDKFLHQLLKKLARLVKCAIVEPFAKKYNVPPWVCNLLLAKIHFEKKVMESVSKNTEHHLRKLNEFSKDFDKIEKAHKRKANMGKGNDGASQHEYFIRFVSYKFDFIVYPLQNDMSKVIRDAEKTIASAGCIIVVMGKMIFEIEGYLEQTITETFNPTTKTPKIPDNLRSEILKLSEVSEIGTAYEAHVQKESDHLKGDLSAIMTRHGFKLPYKVKTVIQQATAMMADIQHENGKLIKSPYPDNKAKYREGVLGAFAQNDENKLFGLTAAHVVFNPSKEEHDVYIQDRVRYRKFANCYKRFTISTGNRPLPLTDIAAVKVNDDFESHCIRHMKDDSGINRSAAIADELGSQLVKRFVYKHGSKSGLTSDIVCSEDFGGDTFQYILMIDFLPGDENGCFAKRGDTGAVFCTMDVNSDCIWKVLILSACHHTKMLAFEGYSGQTITGPKKQTPKLPGKLSNSFGLHYLLGNTGSHIYNGNGPTKKQNAVQNTTINISSDTHRHTVNTTCANGKPLMGATMQTEERSDRQVSVNGCCERFLPNKRKRRIGAINDFRVKRLRQFRAYRNKNMQEKSTQYDAADFYTNSLSRIPTEIDICQLSHRIGREYEELAFVLGLTQAELDHIQEDYKFAVRRIREILIKWRQKMGDRAKFGELKNALIQVGISPEKVFENIMEA